MQQIGSVVGGIGFLICLICDIIVIVKMFQNGQTGLGILGIVLTLCACIPGFLFTLIYGWVRSGEWNLKNIMLVYTVGAVMYIAGSAMNPTQYSDIQGRIQQNQPAPP